MMDLLLWGSTVCVLGNFPDDSDVDSGLGMSSTVGRNSCKDIMYVVKLELNTKGGGHLHSISSLSF